MNGFNVSFLPQQVLHDAVANSAPVQKSDEDLLYRALISWHTKNGSYKDALNSLHGVSPFILPLIYASSWYF